MGWSPEQEKLGGAGVLTDSTYRPKVYTVFLEKGLGGMPSRIQFISREIGPWSTSWVENCIVMQLLS